MGDEQKPDAEIARLNKVIQALMNRAERNASIPGSNFSLLHTAVTLGDQVSQRTKALEDAMLENQKITRALKDSENRFRHLTELSSDWYWEVDESFRFTMMSAGIQSNGGSPASWFIGKSMWKVHERMDQTRVQAQRTLMEAHLPFAEIEYEIIFSDSNSQWFSNTGEPLFDTANNFIGYRGTGKYITERKKAELLRSAQGDVLEMIATGTSLERIFMGLMEMMEAQIQGIMASILLLDGDGIHLRHAPAPNLPEAYLQQIDGVAMGPSVGSCGTAVYRREMVVVSDISSDPLWADYRDLAQKFNLRSCWSTPIFNHGGKLFGTFALYSKSVRSPTLEQLQLIEMATRFAGIAIERKETEERIAHMAHHDALTGLPNRTLLKERLRQAMLFADRYNRKVIVAFIDLDNFKLINDTMSHSAGDEVLKVVARRMQGCVRDTDTVVRLGGDEFVIILFDQSDQIRAITPLIENLRSTIEQEIVIDDKKLEVTFSMGLVAYPNDGADIDDLLMNADVAMYRAKELGRNTYQFYS